MGKFFTMTWEQTKPAQDYSYAELQKALQGRFNIFSQQNILHVLFGKVNSDASKAFKEHPVLAPEYMNALRCAQDAFFALPLAKHRSCPAILKNVFAKFARVRSSTADMDRPIAPVARPRAMGGITGVTPKSIPPKRKPRSTTSRRSGRSATPSARSRSNSLGSVPSERLGRSRSSSVNSSVHSERRGRRGSTSSNRSYGRRGSISDSGSVRIPHAGPPGRGTERRLAETADFVQQSPALASPDVVPFTLLLVPLLAVGYYLARRFSKPRTKNAKPAQDLPEVDVER